MMMQMEGGPGAVMPLDFNEKKRPLPKWIWLAAGASLAVHAAFGAWLYSQRFEMPALPPQAEAPRTVIELIRPPAPKLNPAPAQPAAQPTPIRQPINPAPAAETAPFTPVEAPEVTGVFTPEIITAPAPGAITAANGSGQGTAPAGPPMIVNPDWLQRPTGDQLLRHYPPRALNAGITGSVTMRCAVSVRGTLSDCTVLSETPAGQGFGRAAQQLVRYFRISPMVVDGAPVNGARVDIPLRFNVE